VKILVVAGSQAMACPLMEAEHGRGGTRVGHQLEIHQKESLARKTRYLYNFIYTFIDILHTTNSNLIVV
jgi:hypothetical protein